MSNATPKFPLLDEAQAPDFISRAALRAHRKWQDPEHKAKVLKTTGSPGFRPSRQQAKQVELLAAMGLNHKEIGHCIGIEPTLVKFYYDYELKTAKLRANVAVGKKCLEGALQGDSDLIKFWLQTQAGWTTKVQVDHTGVDKDADEARSAREKLLEGDDLQEASETGT